jgi:hypothetical protein
MDYSCNPHTYQTDNLKWLKSFKVFTAIIAGPLVCLTLITTSGLLLLVARRAAAQRSERLRWQGVLTVISTTAAYLASYLPAMLFYAAREITPSVDQFITIKRVAYFLTNMNIMANFFVYSLTVSSFREFLIKRVTRLPGTSSLVVRLRPRHVMQVGGNSSAELRKEGPVHETLF